MGWVGDAMRLETGTPRGVYMCGTVAEELRMCGWGRYTREASVRDACCLYSGVINMS